MPKPAGAWECAAALDVHMRSSVSGLVTLLPAAAPADMGHAKGCGDCSDANAH